jgi:hypothetical protein
MGDWTSTKKNEAKDSLLVMYFIAREARGSIILKNGNFLIDHYFAPAIQILFVSHGVAKTQSSVVFCSIRGS